jgi:putative Holliday junction resolvase
MTVFKELENVKQFFSKENSILGIDLGKKRIGIAISDKTNTIASPKTILHRKSNQKDFLEIKKIIEENQVKSLVIGFPIDMNGLENEMTQFVENFANNFDFFLEKKLPIFLFDERLSSFEARSFAKSKLSRKKEFYDDIAASIILEQFISFLKS